MSKGILLRFRQTESTVQEIKDCIEELILGWESWQVQILDFLPFLRVRFLEYRYQGLGRGWGLEAERDVLGRRIKKIQVLEGCTNFLPRGERGGREGGYNYFFSPVFPQPRSQETEAVNKETGQDYAEVLDTAQGKGIMFCKVAGWHKFFPSVIAKQVSIPSSSHNILLELSL